MSSQNWPPYIQIYGIYPRKNIRLKRRLILEQVGDPRNRVEVSGDLGNYLHIYARKRIPQWTPICCEARNFRPWNLGIKLRMQHVPRFSLTPSLLTRRSKKFYLT